MFMLCQFLVPILVIFGKYCFNLRICVPLPEKAVKAVPLLSIFQMLKELRVLENISLQTDFHPEDNDIPSLPINSQHWWKPLSPHLSLDREPIFPTLNLSPSQLPSISPWFVPLPWTPDCPQTPAVVWQKNYHFLKGLRSLLPQRFLWFSPQNTEIQGGWAPELQILCLVWDANTSHSAEKSTLLCVFIHISVLLLEENHIKSLTSHVPGDTIRGKK